MGRSAYDFEAYATKDLRRYLKSFELPRPPPCDIIDLFNLPSTTTYSKSHENNNLTIRHERWRVLENMCPFDLEEGKMATWLNSNIPVKPELETDSLVDARYNLPEKLGVLLAHKSSSISAMLPWLSLPIITATRVLHSSFPWTYNWQFCPVEPDKPDHALFRYLLWRPDGGQDFSGSLVVAYQTPFILNECDMREFVECKSFPAFDTRTQDKLPSKYRLWAKIWDTCYASKTQWFVLTTYTQWVFGAFSPGGRVAFVSPLFQQNCTSPTILEWLTYWLASAMQLRGAFRLPKVDEPISTEDVDMEPVTPVYVPKAPRSESVWPCKDEEPGYSAGVDLESVMSGEGSLSSFFGVPASLDVNRPVIQKWISECRTATHHKINEDDLLVPIIPEFEFPENSKFVANALVGEWMISM